MTDTTDPNAPQATPEPAPEAKEMTAEERLVMLAQEMEALRDKWLRSEAEMQNLRTRTQREVADARASATQTFASLHSVLRTLPRPGTITLWTPHTTHAVKIHK
jgi:molecular chaperone GrpE